jgi:hypothetical protein
MSKSICAKVDIRKDFQKQSKMKYHFSMKTSFFSYDIGIVPHVSVRGQWNLERNNYYMT